VDEIVSRNNQPFSFFRHVIVGENVEHKANHKQDEVGNERAQKQLVNVARHIRQRETDGIKQKDGAVPQQPIPHVPVRKCSQCQARHHKIDEEVPVHAVKDERGDNVAQGRQSHPARIKLLPEEELIVAGVLEVVIDCAA